MQSICRSARVSHVLCKGSANLGFQSFLVQVACRCRLKLPQRPGVCHSQIRCLKPRSEYVADPRKWFYCSAGSRLGTFRLLPWLMSLPTNVDTHFLSAVSDFNS
jgi:hypothetical protein